MKKIDENEIPITVYCQILPKASREISIVEFIVERTQ